MRATQPQRQRGAGLPSMPAAPAARLAGCAPACSSCRTAPAGRRRWSRARAPAPRAAPRRPGARRRGRRRRRHPRRRRPPAAPAPACAGASCMRSAAQSWRARSRFCCTPARVGGARHACRRRGLRFCGDASQCGAAASTASGRAAAACPAHLSAPGQPPAPRRPRRCPHCRCMTSTPAGSARAGQQGQVTVTTHGSCAVCPAEPRAGARPITHAWVIAVSPNVSARLTEPACPNRVPRGGRCARSR